MGDEFPATYSHIAVRMDHTIIVFGGVVHDAACKDTNRHIMNCQLQHTIFVFNIYIEKWRRYRIPKWKRVKHTPQHFEFACGVSIGEDIYTFGRGWFPNNQLWRLTRNTYGCFNWKNIFIKQKQKNPSPRGGHCGWEYRGNLYIFGGEGPSSDEYLNEYGDYNDEYNNQLLQFNPDKMEWINLRCFGTAPEPREQHAATTFIDKTLLCGRHNDTQIFDDLYELDMPSLTWTKISGPHIPRLGGIGIRSLNVTTDYQLVLHQYKSIEKPSETWIIDLKSWSWRLHSCDKVCPKLSHTGCVGINNNVIIIGGSCRNDISCAPCCVCSVMLEPKSLQQLAIKTVYEHRATLSWTSLPKKLIKLMKYGKGDDVIDDCDAPQEEEKTCALWDW